MFIVQGAEKIKMKKFELEWYRSFIAEQGSNLHHVEGLYMRTRDLAYWLFLAPVLLALLLVIIVPLLIGVYYSFTDWNGIKVGSFVGLENYIDAFKDKEFLASLWFTVKFSVVSIIFTNVIGLGLALIVTTKIKSSKLLRTVFFMPNLIGGLILGFIWQFIFIKVFAGLGDILGIEGLKGWLSTTETGFWGLVILMSWQMAGYIMIIYIAYLEGLPGELLEAAEIDGAGPFKKFRYVIFPLVAPAFTVSMFLTLSNSFKLYDQNLSLTAGGPFNSTQMVAMEIFKTAFGETEMAFAQSKAVIFFIIVAVISLTQVYINKKREVEM
ncbi:raffinose/stachyose/melibiose transport system permease protein [Metabacillus niabensis]|uniref:Raffinose/stachyose/melibiose transport system permease protein n=2 Tax=Bacillaceae TaxID=186817 RepID=A0ABT9YW56_9BACI|nr:raffinose/stachyose/melibiose transport system permease protein [Metabacillus niabensis]